MVGLHLPDDRCGDSNHPIRERSDQCGNPGDLGNTLLRGHIDSDRPAGNDNFARICPPWPFPERHRHCDQREEAQDPKEVVPSQAWKLGHQRNRELLEVHELRRWSKQFFGSSKFERTRFQCSSLTFDYWGYGSMDTCEGTESFQWSNERVLLQNETHNSS